MKKLTGNTKMILGIIEEIAENSYEDYVKAIIVYETNCKDASILDKVYKEYMAKDTTLLLNNDLVGKTLELKVKKGDKNEKFN